MTKKSDHGTGGGDGLSRRRFIAGAMASAGAVATHGLVAPFRARAAVRNPLMIPPEVSPANYGITAAPGVDDLGGGHLSNVLAYNGSSPGPTFRANSGDAPSIMLTNNLAQETTIHWHGMVVPEIADGHPKDHVMPGDQYLYQFPIVQRACTNWYHPHPHMMTGEQINMGLTGVFIVNDAEEAALGLPSGARDIPLIIRDAELDGSGNIMYDPPRTGFLGDFPLVNSTIDPKLDVDTALYRFRILIGGSFRVYKLSLSNGAPFTLIGNDGGLLETVSQVTQIEMAPAERVDVLIDFRGLPPGTSIMLRDQDTGWDILEFVVANQVVDPTPVPAGTLSVITPLSNPVRTRTFNFQAGAFINGRRFDMDRIDFTVPQGQTELWRFTTTRSAPHPIHVHGASFQVISRTGGRGVLFPWEGGWKDTVLLQKFETVDVLIRFDLYTGIFLLHCHKLEHEDMGMMSNFEVV